MIIAIDGPSGSGKGTVAKLLAEYLDFAMLDTGSLYRAVALKVVQNKQDPSDVQLAIKAAESVDANLLDNPELRNDEVAKAASFVAAIPEVRDLMLKFQRDFAHFPPGGKAGAIIDGRDIGTVVCPDADIKLFLTADLEVRAKRRFKELQLKGINSIYSTVLEDMRQRDLRDETRATSPSKPSSDAHIIDTTDMNITQVVDVTMLIIKEHKKS